jgi:hypothetical protein
LKAEMHQWATFRTHTAPEREGGDGIQARVVDIRLRGREHCYPYCSCGGLVGDTQERMHATLHYIKISLEKVFHNGPFPL